MARNHWPSGEPAGMFVASKRAGISTPGSLAKSAKNSAQLDFGGDIINSLSAGGDGEHETETAAAAAAAATTGSSTRPDASPPGPKRWREIPRPFPRRRSCFLAAHDARRRSDLTPPSLESSRLFLSVN